MEKNPAEDCVLLLPSTEGQKLPPFWQLLVFGVQDSGKREERVVFMSVLLCLVSKIFLDLIAESLHINLLELQQKRKHVEQQGTTEVAKKWGMLHKQGLQQQQ